MTLSTLQTALIVAIFILVMLLFIIIMLMMREANRAIESHRRMHRWLVQELIDLRHAQEDIAKSVLRLIPDANITQEMETTNY